MEYPINTPEWHFQQILKHLGENPNREGLAETPKLSESLVPSVNASGVRQPTSS